jgi:hypothetical protein
MKVQRSHLRIAVYILAALVIYNVWYFFGPKRTQPGPPVPTQPVGAQQAAGPAMFDPSTIPAPPDVDSVKTPAWGRDPFLFGNETREVRLAVRTRATGPAPLVRSVLYSSTRKLAIVDGRIVAVGDAVGAYRVAEIEQAAVVFTTAGGERRRVEVRGTAPLGLSR